MSAVENPAAFPCIDAGHGIPYQDGMTLRDWFAGQALPDVIRAMQLSEIAGHPEAGGGPAGFAATAYDIADAMLAERAKGGAA